MFHSLLILLREIFEKNGYPENLINACFKLFLNRIHIRKGKFSYAVEKSLRISPSLFELDHCKLKLNCKSPSKSYLTVVNCKL